MSKTRGSGGRPASPSAICRPLKHVQPSRALAGIHTITIERWPGAAAALSRF
jgi:hypothetical protein